MVDWRGFNEVFYFGDQNDLDPLLKWKKFHSWVSDYSLFDFPLQNTLFTWSNFRSNVACSKLDRFFASQQWLEIFLRNSPKGLPRPISDHCPLLLDMDKSKNGPQLFRFENMWPRHQSSKQNVKSWWEEATAGKWRGCDSKESLWT